jgi:hypothetical protein
VIARVPLGLLFLLAGVLGCAGTPALLPPPASESGALSHLLREAREKRLADAPQWRALLHQHKRLAREGTASFVGSSSFFRSPRGREDAAAELEATLVAFFRPDDAVRGEEPAHCAYPARFAWLGGELGFDRQSLRLPGCPLYEEWREAIGPVSAASLVFADSFMNNPSSMFGHTLIRFDRLRADAPGERRDLLAYAVNFAAETGNDDGALYAMKGIVGVYPAYFSILPYYAKVRQYTDWESRDLWEYPLALGADRVDFLLMHLWELQGVAFPYYYFSRNCSYHLLGLLEVARPDLAIRHPSRTYTIPADSVKEIVAEVGIDGAPAYRPSSATLLRYRSRALSPEERTLVKDLAHGDATPDGPRLTSLPARERAAVLGLAYDYLAHTTPGSRKPEVRGRALALLMARSRVPVRGDPAGSPPVPGTRPDEGHASRRLRSGVGVRHDRLFFEIGARPGFHDLLDPPGGHLEGAEIALFETAFRYYPVDDELRLHRFRLVDIVSAAARDEMLKPVSWTFRTGFDSRLVEDSDDDLRNRLLFQTRSGAGVSYRVGEHSAANAFVEGALDVGTALDPSYALGATARLSFHTADVAERWAGRLYAEVTPWLAGDTRTALVFGFDQRFSLTRGLALELKLSTERDFNSWWLETGLFLRMYY